jgi:DNA-binding LacI/PurR family transcriptional regulator
VGGVSLKDVAALAGVSVRTVSNVVNRFPHVAPDTRARVEQALEQLNYRPNLAARNLRRGRSVLIGLVVPEIDSPYFSELAAHLVLAAEERSWTVLVDQTGGDPARERAFL